MDGLLSSMFPQIKFTGAFLTEGLTAAMLISVIQKSRELSKEITTAQLYVQLVVESGGAHYRARGTIMFRTTEMEIEVKAFRTGGRSPELNLLLSIMEMDKLEMPNGMSFPRLFLGVDGEPYNLGEITVLKPSPNHSS